VDRSFGDTDYVKKEMDFTKKGKIINRKITKL